MAWPLHDKQACTNSSQAGEVRVGNGGAIGKGNRELVGETGGQCGMEWREMERANGRRAD